MSFFFPAVAATWKVENIPQNAFPQQATQLSSIYANKEIAE